MTTSIDNSTVQAACQGDLSYPALSDNVTKTLIYSELQNESLLSMGTFCDDGYVAIFTKNNVFIIKNNNFCFSSY